MKAILPSQIVFGTCLLLAAPAFSQTLIKGEVKETEANASTYANVLLLKAQDSTLVKDMLSDKEGRYQFENVGQGKYLVKVFMLGYKTAFSPKFEVLPGQSTITMAPVRLAYETVALKEVQVEAQKPLYELDIDKLVVNVQSSITTAGGTALEVLERSPGVQVNRMSTSISMSGKQGVQVMINGKLSRLLK